jgi:hypothetical protein
VRFRKAVWLWDRNVTVGSKFSATLRKLGENGTAPSHGPHQQGSVGRWAARNR